ncbi:pyridoxal 5'-phosphate synthase glutaminase subunit PdxT [Pseudonocardia sp.]|uniref:pyridoxal 5'-phosphate synthase glutaminase subunit PdxT n=1 Tax=Pseudonocardia sp. TaxID=60912 RepID=UPI0039C8E3EE
MIRRSGPGPSTSPTLGRVTTVGVLALQGDVREHLAALTACGVRAVSVRRASELDAVDALVLPGGESTTMSRLLETFELLKPVRARIAGGMPTYGSCAGMILLASQVLDGRPDQRQLGGLDVVVRRNAFGRQVDSFETDLMLAGVDGGPVHAVFIRAPWVESAGPEVEVLATVPRGPDAGAAEGRIVAVRQGMVLATAFHPELTGDGRVHRLFCDLVRGGDRPYSTVG